MGWRAGVFGGRGLGGEGGGWGDDHRHTARWGFGGWFCSYFWSCVDTLVVCTLLPLINIGALLTICIKKILNTIGYFSLGNQTP